MFKFFRIQSSPFTLSLSKGICRRKPDKPHHPLTLSLSKGRGFRGKNHSPPETEDAFTGARSSNRWPFLSMYMDSKIAGTPIPPATRKNSA